MTVRITEISIQDTLGTRAANFAPGTITRITGANGTGKSSILRALTYIFAGGLDPSIIRKGAEKSVIGFRLSNGVKVEKTTGIVKPRRGAAADATPRYKADLEITDSDGAVINAPQTYLEELAAALSVNPAQLLAIDTSTVPGRRALAEQLIKLVPIRFSPEEIAAACAYRSADTVDFYSADVSALASPQVAPTDLDGLKKLKEQVTEARRRSGIIRDENDGAIDSLTKGLPEGTTEDLAPQQTALEQEALEIERAVAVRQREIDKNSSDARAQAQKAYSEAVKAADAEYQSAVAIIEKRLKDAMTEALIAHNDMGAAILKVERDEVKELEGQAEPERRRVASELAVVKQKLAAYHRAATIREQIELSTAKLRAAAWKYDQLSGVLERMEKLRLAKLDDMPVPGLVVEDGQAFLDGVEWSNVNLARRVEAVLQICALQSGDLPLLLIDDCEHLDEETRRGIEDGLAAGGYQVIEAMVTDAPLSIEVRQ